MKILVVDDEQLLVKGIKFNLENEGYQVLTAYDGAAAVELARRESLDLIILDLMMPQLSGSEACMKIREFSDVPIIMLTARSEDADKLMGFACGADDYVTKPFNILELKARIKALLRRAKGPARPGRNPALLTAGDLSLDTEQRVAIRDGRTIDLTAKEYDLIELLMKNPRRVYSRESLMNLVWGYSYAGDYRTVDVHIRRLREKLERVPAEPEYIMTKWGVGYYFAGETSLQFKFSMSYILIILAVLVLLNTYPLLVSQSLVFRTKETAMKSSVKMVESALSGLPELTEENVGQALASVEETGVSRLLVTDTSGCILFDTREGGSAKGMYAMYTEIVQALDGSDAFYCRYDSHAFLSRGASPVVYRNRIIGAVYAYEYDTQQAELLQSFQTNLTRISLLIGVLVVALSALLSRAFTRKIRELLQAIRQVREGAYSHRASVRGNDEIAQLATEFNSLTDRLQTTEAARRRFVSDASHELKTPLAGIRLLTDSILQTEDMNADTTREFVEDIGREAQRLSRITEDLLRLTRLDSGIQDAAYPVSVSRVLERVVRMLGVVAREKEVTLTYETDEDAVVRATEDDIHQILYNLMENGIKYSGSMGFVHTTLKTVGDTVVISVEDNGIGIPNEDMEHIFERFYRVDKNRSRAVGGTGLGLSIVSDTVRRRGGSIRAQHRQSGSGTVFIVELPLARREEADE